MSDVETGKGTEEVVLDKNESLYRVIFLNDDETLYAFVVKVLMDIYDYDESYAIQMAETVHNNGRACVAIYPKSIAYDKRKQTIMRAMNENQPLKVRVEPLLGEN